jgi:hypothetical protein
MDSADGSQKQKDDYQIQLNFLPIDMGQTPCKLYRRACADPHEERPMPDATAHKLPVTSVAENEWISYWVLHEPREGFTEFDYSYNWNSDISKRVLFNSLRRAIISGLESGDYKFPPNSFIQEVSLTMERIQKVRSCW